MYVKIIAKADLVIKMIVPDAYKFSDDTKMAREDSMRIIRPPSYYANSKMEGLEVQEGSPKDWKEKLAEWRTNQKASGTIHDYTSRQIEATDSGYTSVLALLQAAIPALSIVKHFQKNLLNASRRMAGLFVMS
jgi:hypothetical protein